jgi:hypothetical protein
MEQNKLAPLPTGTRRRSLLVESCHMHFSVCSSLPVFYLTDVVHCTQVRRSGHNRATSVIRTLGSSLFFISLS